ncbi:MAG: FGGY-family carbohydrate kinase [Candidatus Bathyarchaeia archaeon]
MLLAADMGTTNAKACIFSENGNLVAMSRSEYPKGQHQSPYTTFEVTLNLIADVVRKSGIPKSEIQGLVFSARNDQGATVALDRQDRPVEMRVNIQEVQELSRELERELFPTHLEELLGVLGIVPLLKWMQTRNREQYESIAKIMGVKEYAIYQLSGAFTCDTLDRGYLRVPVSFCERKGIIEDAEAKLPEIVPPITIVGGLKSEYASKLGLREGTPICVGSRDGNCGNVGCGTVEPGQACTTLATYGVIRVVWDRPVLDIPKNRISPRLHAIPGQWLIDSTPGGGAMALRWFRNTFAEPEQLVALYTGEDVYKILDKEAEAVDESRKPLIFLPYMTGMSAPERERKASAVLFGLGLEHTRGDIIRAIMAGVVYAIRSGMEIIENAGAKVTELRATGGGSRAPVWNQMQADIMNLPVLRSSVEEVECLGASILLATGLGIYRSVREAVDNMVRIKETYHPRADRHTLHDNRYRLYLDLCNRIVEKGLWNT